MFEKMREGFKKHEGILFPLFTLIFLDFLFNDGRFRKKITAAVESIIDSITGKFSKELPATKDKDE